MSEIIDVPMHEQRDIRTVTVEIRQLHRQGQEMALRYIVEIGRRLAEAKKMLNHGEWGQWVKDELPFSQSTAGNFMRIFEEYGADQTSFFGEVKSQALANLSYTKALRLLAIEDEEAREDFVETHDVESMSTRELEQAIRERDEANRKADELARLVKEADGAVADAERAKDELEEKLKQAQADSGSHFRAQQEAAKKAEELRQRLKDAQDAANKEREAARKAREDLKKLKETPAEVPAEKREEIRKAEEAKAEEAVKAAEERAEELRRQLAAADPDTAVFAVHFKAAQTEILSLIDLYDRIAEADPARGEKLTNAVRQQILMPLNNKFAG